MAGVFDGAKYLQQLSAILHSFRMNNILCDTILVTSDRELSAHSIVLAAASSVFESALRDCIPVAGSGYRLEVLGLDGAAMELILHLVYSGIAALESFSSSVVDRDALLTVCDQLRLDWLKTELENCQCLCVQSTDLLSALDKDVDLESILHGFVSEFYTDEHLQQDASNNSNVLVDELCALDEGTANECGNYVCDICKECFLNIEVFRKHRSQHRGCALCDYCQLTFEAASLLQLHRSTDCQMRPIPCNICDVYCVGYEKLREHASTTHADSHCCSDCYQPFSDPTSLRLHRKLHRKIQLISCRVCGKRFNSRRKMLDHRATHSAVSVVCGICGEVFHTKAQFDEHALKVHGSSQVLLCLTCGVPFPTSSDLHAHMQMHNLVVTDPGAGPHKCTICGRTFSRLSNLQNHRRSHVVDRPFVCPICSRTFKDNCLQKHMLTHERGPRPHACDECPLTFARLADLNVHRQCHTGEMRHKCHVCNRPFRKKNTLLRHLRVHTQERPYVCETCGKSFKILFQLRMHASTHLAERPHECETCGKTFFSSLRLKKHAVVHSGVKPYSCSICSRAFYRRANMRAHMRIHQDKAGGIGGDMVASTNGTAPDLSDGSELQCAFCPEKFAELASLHTHLQLHSQEMELSTETVLDVKEDLSGIESIEVMYCKMEDQADTYIALPVIHLSEVDSDSSPIVG